MNFSSIKHAWSIATVIAVVGLTFTGGQAVRADSSYQPPAKIPILTSEQMKNVGPNGEESVPGAKILQMLTPDDVEKIKAKHFKAAIIWYTQAPIFTVFDRGIADVFKKLDITVVAETDYETDAQRYKNQVMTVLAKKPDVIITVAADPNAAAAALQPAIDAGVKIEINSNPPAGWVAGKQYIGAVAGNPYELGVLDAEMLAKAVNFKGDVGLIYHDANFYATNLRDRVLKTTLVRKYPDVHIVDEEGFSDQALGEQLTTAMLTKHPSIKGIYGSWDTVTEGVLAGLRNLGRPDVKVVSMDLNNNNVLNMVQNQQVYGIAVDQPFSMGQAFATESALGLIGKSVPPFANMESLACTKENIEQCWKTVFQEPLPANIETALKK